MIIDAILMSTHNIIQLMVFEEINSKIYWCVKSDIGRFEAEAKSHFTHQ